MSEKERDQECEQRERWDARYREHGRLAIEPAAFLLGLDRLLPRHGRALDVGAGTGRNAIWLARRGLDVTAVDISRVGLELAAKDARAAGVTLHTLLADLEQDPLPAGPWDVILDFHFLHRPLFSQFAAALAPGGYLVFVQPTVGNLLRHPRPSRRFLLDDGELPVLISRLGDPGLRIIEYREGWTPEGRCEARLVARRTGP